MANKRVVTPYDEMTYTIIGCAMAAHRHLGPGQREDVYQRDLAVRLSERGLSFEVQKLLEVYDSVDQSQLIGYYIPDFIVTETVVVEIKALKGLENSHLAQVVGYLAVTGCPVGLLINFGRRSLEHRRVFPPRDIADYHANRQWLFVPDWLKPDQ